MSLNKKAIAVAIVGVFAAGNAAAANLSASGGAVPAYFAKEIIATPAAPVTLTTSASTATQLTWDVGYNFSQGEVRYVRVECSDNIEFDSATTVALSDPAAGNIGSINGLGSNVMTFSITSDATGANNVLGTDTLQVVGDHDITGTDQDVTCSVGIYDQPSQAQAGGNAGLIANTSFSGAYLRFAPSYRLIATATEHTADVEAVPSFTRFVVNGNTTPTIASMGTAITYGLRDPDGAGAQTAPFRIDGTPIALTDLLAAGTTIAVAGDYALAANAAAPLYTAAALPRVQLNATNASVLTATTATFAVGNVGFAGADFDLTTRGAIAIPAADYTASLNAVAAAPLVYHVSNISGVKFGSIVRNGTELQAPLAQVPTGWLARMVLTNTGTAARPYTLTIIGESGNTIVTNAAGMTGTVPANGTVVVDLPTNVFTSFTGAPRATIIANVAGSTKQIQGLYQIVNPDKGSISNHVMVRPGTN